MDVGHDVVDGGEPHGLRAVRLYGLESRKRPAVVLAIDEAEEEPEIPTKESSFPHHELEEIIELVEERVRATNADVSFAVSTALIPDSTRWNTTLRALFAVGLTLLAGIALFLMYLAQPLFAGG